MAGGRFGGGADNPVNVLRAGQFATATGTISSAVFGEGSLRAVPVFFSRTTRVDGLSVHIPAAGAAGAVVRLGLYRDGGTGIPGALVVDAGTVNGTLTGHLVASFSALTLAPGLYWAGAVVQGGAASRPTVTSTFSPVSQTSSSAEQIMAGWENVSAVAGALPAAWEGSLISGQSHRVALRGAA